jgi:hypothetical protein
LCIAMRMTFALHLFGSKGESGCVMCTGEAASRTQGGSGAPMVAGAAVAAESSRQSPPNSHLNRSQRSSGAPAFLPLSVFLPQQIATDSTLRPEISSSRTSCAAPDPSECPTSRKKTRFFGTLVLSIWRQIQTLSDCCE